MLVRHDLLSVRRADVLVKMATEATQIRELTADETSEVFGGKYCLVCYNQVICSLPNLDGSVNCTVTPICYYTTCS